MTRKLVCSGLVLALGLAASAQPPKEPKKEPPPADNLDAALTAALKNHPDIRLAEAKRQVADAELAQAKLAVAHKVTAAHARVAKAKDRVSTEQSAVDNLQSALTRPGIKTDEEQRLRVSLDNYLRELTKAKADLAAAEAEFRTAAGLSPGTPVAAEGSAAAVALGLKWLAGQQEDASAKALQDYRLTAAAVAALLAANTKPQPGSASDKLRQLVDKPVALTLDKPVPFDEAMAQFLAASGLSELTVRYPDWASAKVLKDPPMVSPLKGEQTPVAWLQLILDDFNREVAAGKAVPLPPHQVKKFEVYVREYGLLIAQTDLAPPGAITLSEFAKQVRAEKAAEAAKPEPKK